jgi:hypothetical protein
MENESKEYMVIKLRDNARCNSISNMAGFNIRKGETRRVPLDFPVDERFEVVEHRGVAIPRKTPPLTETACREVLAKEDYEVIYFVKSSDLTLDDMELIYKMERNGRRRKPVLKAIRDICPEPHEIAEIKARRKAQQEKELTMRKMEMDRVHRLQMAGVAV